MSPDLNTWLGEIPWVPLTVVAALVVVFLVSSRSGKKNREKLVTKLAAGAKVVDVRTKGEYAGGHFEGAVNAPLDSLASKSKTWAKDEAIVVYCASGARSAQAVSLLKSGGFTDVTNAGGLGSLSRLRP